MDLGVVGGYTILVGENNAHSKKYVIWILLMLNNNYLKINNPKSFFIYEFFFIIVIFYSNKIMMNSSTDCKGKSIFYQMRNFVWVMLVPSIKTSLNFS